MWSGVYFSILSTSENDIDAISEAYRLAQADNVNSVEVYRCGTQSLIAHVFSDGEVGLASDRAASDSNTIQPPLVEEIQAANKRLGDKLKARDAVIDDLIDLTAQEIYTALPRINQPDVKLEVSRLRGKLGALNQIRDLEG